MPQYTLNINGTRRTVTAAADTPLLWVLRDKLGLTGTKFGCGIAQCGACTVHVDGHAKRSCVHPIGELVDAKITTIEGLIGPAGLGSPGLGDLDGCAPVTTSDSPRLLPGSIPWWIGESWD